VYGLAYDAVNASTVFSSGQGATSLQFGTWGYDGVTWTLLDGSTTAPPAQSASSLVFDGVSQRVLLIGGSTGAIRATTWEWSNFTWSPGPSLPSPRAWSGAAFDSRRAKVVLFGGHDGAQALDQTLEY
jgi:hypothetical protein